MNFCICLNKVCKIFLRIMIQRIMTKILTGLLTIILRSPSKWKSLGLLLVLLSLLLICF